MNTYFYSNFILISANQLFIYIFKEYINIGNIFNHKNTPIWLLLVTVILLIIFLKSSKINLKLITILSTGGVILILLIYFYIFILNIKDFNYKKIEYFNVHSFLDNLNLVMFTYSFQSNICEVYNLIDKSIPKFKVDKTTYDFNIMLETDDVVIIYNKKVFYKMKKIMIYTFLICSIIYLIAATLPYFAFLNNQDIINKNILEILFYKKNIFILFILIFVILGFITTIIITFYPITKSLYKFKKDKNLKLFSVFLIILQFIICYISIIMDISLFTFIYLVSLITSTAVVVLFPIIYFNKVVELKCSVEAKMRLRKYTIFNKVIFVIFAGINIYLIWDFIFN